MKPEQELESGSLPQSQPTMVGKKTETAAKKTLTPRDIWESYKKLAGIQKAFKDTIPMDLCHVSTCYRARATVEIWREQHKGLRVTPGEFLAHPYLSDDAWNMISCWLHAYNPYREKPYNPMKDLEYYIIPDQPYLVHLKDTWLWIALAPTTDPREDTTKQRTLDRIHVWREKAGKLDEATEALEKKEKLLQHANNQCNKHAKKIGEIQKHWKQLDHLDEGYMLLPEDAQALNQLDRLLEVDP